MSTTDADTANKVADSPEFPTLLNEVDGIFANARIAYSLTLADRAMAHGEWARAVEILGALADKIAGYDIAPEGLRELMRAAAWCGIHAAKFSDIPAIQTLFERHAARAWPENATAFEGESTFIAQKRAGMPWRLGEVLRRAERRGRFPNGLALGELITATFPACPLGPYAAAHFADRMLQSGHTELSKTHTARTIADAFISAAGLADALLMPEFSGRARLRAGVLLLRTGQARDEGRACLRGLDPRGLSRANRLWYAVGMAHSPFWLDRVRAADQIIELSADSTPAHADPQAPQPADIRAAIRHLLASAPLQLEALETDRLSELIDLLGEAEDAGHLRAHIELRAHLDHLADLPLARAGEAAEYMLKDPSDSGRAAADFCRIVESIFNDQPTPPPDAAALGRIERFYPLAATVLGVLYAVDTQNASRLATALGSLEGKLRLSKVQAADLKPIGLIWPTLLGYLVATHGDHESQAGADDPTALKRITASAREILSRWTPRAPKPSYGWWALSAHLLANPELDSPWPEHAAQSTRRALRDDVADSPELRTHVLDRLIQRAVEYAPDDELLAWLELAEKS